MGGGTDPVFPSRFIQTPPVEVMQRLGTEGEQLKADTSALEKRLHYLEVTYRNSRESFEQILKSAGARSS